MLRVRRWECSPLMLSAPVSPGEDRERRRGPCHNGGCRGGRPGRGRQQVSLRKTIHEQRPAFDVKAWSSSHHVLCRRLIALRARSRAAGLCQYEGL